MKFDEIKVGDVATTFSGKNFLVVDKFEKNKEVLLAVPEEYGGWVHPNTVYRKPSLWVYYADIVATTNNSGGGKSSSSSNSDIKIGDKVKITNKNALFPCIDSIRAKELMHMEHTVLSLKDNGNTVIIYMPRADGGHTCFSKEYGRAISRSDLMKVENSVKLKTETETKIKIGDKVKVSASAEIPHKIASSLLLKAEFLSKEHEVIEVFPTFCTVKIGLDPKDGGHFIDSKSPGWTLHQGDVTIVSKEPEKESDLSSEIKAGDTIIYNDGFTSSSLNGKKYNVLKVIGTDIGENKTFLLDVPAKDGGYHHPKYEFLQPTWLASATAVKKCTETKMKKVKLKRPEFYPFKLDTPKSVKDGTFTVLDENYKDVTDSILIEVSKEYGGVLRQGYENHSFCVLKENVEFIDESESSVKKEPKYQVLDYVFLPKRFKNELPEEVFNCRRGNEFYEFTIAYRKANPTDVDYFINISETDGGKWEKSISRTGRWINEKFLLSREEMEAEKNKNQPTINQVIQEKLSEKENAKMTTTSTAVAKTANDSSAVTWTRNDIRNYNTILPGAMHLAKTALRWIVRFALKRAGETPKVVRSWITIIDNFLEKHAEKAESIFQWILGWCVKNLAKIRQIPGLKDIPQLVLLEHPELAKFGEYINADAEGDLLGEAVKHAISWVQENVLGSKVLNRIGDVFSGDPKTLARIATEVSADLQKDMEEEDAESEVASAQKPAMVAPAVA